MNWYLKCLRLYFNFSGRARRKEYWMFTLFNFLISFVISLVETLLYGNTIIMYIYSIALLLPGLAVCIRRLHDVGKSGWMYLICLIPVVGAIWLLILFCTDSQPGTNEYGPNPKELEY